MLLLDTDLWRRMVAHCLAGYPLEACGLMAGRRLPAPGDGAAGDRAPAAWDGATGDGAPATGDGATELIEVYPTGNAANSSRIYTVEPRDLLRADRAAEAAGLELIGVWHSHTHSEAYPSPTDVAQAPDPDWHYVLVSLRHADPVLRSYRIRGGKIQEESVVLQ